MENKLCQCNGFQGEPVNQALLNTKKTAKALPTMLLSVLIAFFPKCAMCWGMYMSMFGSLELAQLPYMGWILPVLLGFLGIHLFMLYRTVVQNGYLPFLLSLVGAIVILIVRTYFPSEKWLLITGMMLIISGSLLNSFFNTHLKFINLKFIIK